MYDDLHITLQDSIKTVGFVNHGVAKVVRIRLAGEDGRKLSASVAGDGSPASKLDTDRSGDESEDQTGGLIGSHTRNVFH